MKVLVYADTLRQARKHYPARPDQRVGYRVAGEFKKPEKCDDIVYAGDYPEIKEAYEAKKK